MSALRTLTPGDSAVPLRIDAIADTRTSDVSTLYCTDVEMTEVRVAVQGPPVTDISLETDEWYWFNGIDRAESLEAELFFLSGDGDIEHIETPEQQTHPPLRELDAPWLVQLGASDARIALSVQPRPTESVGKIRIENPETFEIGAVCFTHCDGSGETTVYHREEPETEDEHLLLEHVVDDFSQAAGATLVTRGVAPLAMLSQRLEKASTGDIVATGAEQVFTDYFHANAERIAHRAGADTLDEAVGTLDVDNTPTLLSDYDIGLSPTNWRADWEFDSTALSDASDPQMTDRDYATLIERYLGAEDNSTDPVQLGDCLKTYASADLGLLRGLIADGMMDRFGCPRVSETPTARLPQGQ